MPRTLACFFLALLLLAVALVLPRPARSPTPDEPLALDGVGIVEIRVHGMPDVHFSANETPRLAAPGDARERLSVTRVGDRLLLASEDPSYLGLHLVLPPSVHTLRVDGADISVAPGLVLERLLVESTSTVYWGGDAGYLGLRDVRLPAPPPPADVVADAATDAPASAPGRLPVTPTDSYCAGDCGSMFHINRGRIGQLDVELAREGIEINRTDTIGGATLRLGDRAWLGLGHARRVDHLQVLPLDPAAAQGATDASATDTTEGTP